MPGLSRWSGFVCALAGTVSVFASGAVLHKTGPIQIAADGAAVYAVLKEFDSVSRYETVSGTVTQFALPGAGSPHEPRGLDLADGDGEIWVAASRSDTVFVLSASDGSLLATLPMPHGSRPMTVVVSPDGTRALVALANAKAVVVFDVATRTELATIDGLFSKPFGMTFTTVPDQVWVTHRITDSQFSYMSHLDLADYSVRARLQFDSEDPKSVTTIASDPDPIPEGGYLFTIGHTAQRPGTDRVWLPAQYENFHNVQFTPDSSINAAMHKIDIVDGIDLAERVVMSAVYAHADDRSLLGDGWDAHIGGPIDLTFSADGSTAYIANTFSNDVLVMPTGIGRVRPNGTPPMTEIVVGDKPIGIVANPAADRVYVLNHLSRDLSVIDTVTETELSRVDMVPGAFDWMAGAVLEGAKVFTSSADPRLSSNGKVSCASCHLDGTTDGVIWDFAQLGAGKRKTPTLLGNVFSFGGQVGGLGQLHRAGDRDEFQDFDLTYSNAQMGGTGILTAPNPPLGAPNAGLDPDLDALEVYILTLDPLFRSPARDESTGSLTESAVRGLKLFEATTGPFATNCSTCHPGPFFTDLDFHDVGGFVGSQEFLGPAFNTPSLIGSWDNGTYSQASGNLDDASLMELLKTATGQHGDTSQLTRRQLRDLERFIASIDGDILGENLAGMVDDQPPAVVAVEPLGLDTVMVRFDETVDPLTAGDPANYQITDGLRTFPVTAVQVDGAWGDRVWLTVALEYLGCPANYTLTFGPIEDRAGDVDAAGSNNALDPNAPENVAGFVLDGTVTVSFGDTGDESYPSIARDASTVATLVTWSHTSWWLYPYTTPEMKGFVSFDFVPTLTALGVTDASQIVDARFSAQPEWGHAVELEARRCFMPWGEPPEDWCSNCNGAVTVLHAQYPSISWRQFGAGMVGGDRNDPNQYYPSGNFDVAADPDLVFTMPTMNAPVEFASPEITDAFRFWFDHPTLNYGWVVRILNETTKAVRFHGNEKNDGAQGMRLEITYALPLRGDTRDCNGNSTPDMCELIDGLLPDDNGNGTPDTCDAACGDLDGNGSVGLSDLATLLSNFGQSPAGPFEGDLDGNDVVDISDLALLLANFGASCQ